MDKNHHCSQYCKTICFILLIAGGIKAILLIMDAIPFNSDEAVIGLMARHILVGERPLFFYGQSYMGSLDAYLAALFFAIFGAHSWVIRIVQILLYLLVIVTTFYLMQLLELNNRVKRIVGLFLAIPTVNITLYTTASLGGYNEALLIGNLILILCVMIYRNIPHIMTPAGNTEGKPQWLVISGLGFTIGFGLWVNGLTLVYAIPAGVLILWGLLRNRAFKNWALIFRFIIFGLAGFLIGSCPWWIYGLSHEANSLTGELLGSAVAVESGGWLQIIVNHIISFILFGLTALFGLRPPWSVEWIAIPFLPFIVLFWGSVVVFSIKQFGKWDKKEPGLILLPGVVVTLAAGFIFTSFGTDPSGRYFLPLWIPFSILAAEMVDNWIPRSMRQIVAVCFILVFNLTGTFYFAWKNPPGLTTQFDLTTAIDHRYDDELIHFLFEEQEYCGYSNYWVSYPLAFNSEEQLIFIPRLPYHQDFRYTTRDDRYKPYTDYVETCDRVAYITTHNPGLEKYLRNKLEEKVVSWNEKVIGDYLVFHNLSRVVRPSDIGLGVTQTKSLEY